MFALLAQESTKRLWTEQRIEFEHLPRHWWAVLTLLVVAGLCWWVIRTYQREARVGASRTMRIVLAVLRCCVLLLLLAIWLQPVLATYRHELIESYTVLALDDSSSMKIEDAYSDPDERARVEAFFDATTGDEAAPLPVTRAEVVRRLLQHDSFLDGLARKNRVKIVAFSDHTTELATLPATRADGPEEAPAPPLSLPSFAGSSTDLGQALRHVVHRLEGAPIAGFIVVSDGAFNHGESVDVLGRFAQARGVAVHAVGVGDPSPPRNARVLELAAPASAFVKDPFAVRGRIAASGMDGEVLTVEFTEQPLGGADAGPRVLATRSVAVGPDGTVEPLEFQHRNTRPGRYAYGLNIVAATAESITRDNRMHTPVNVLDNKLRVLVVSSGPSWTYRYVARLLQRDETFNLSCWLQSADRTAVRDGNTIIDHLPATPEELFEYDIIVLLDPDPRELPPDWAQLIDEHVIRNGAGLVYASARKHTPEFFRDPRAEAIVRLLPVTPEPEADLILNQIGYYQKSSSSIEFPRTAWSHPVLGGGSQIPEAMWRELGEVYWHFPVKHEKPAATVLMRHGHPRMRNANGGHVLLATQFAGAGRCAFLGFDDTWRWRRYGEELFDQFWVQLIRYTAESKLMGGQTRGRIQTDRDRYDVGEPVIFSATLTDPAHQPLERPAVTLTVTPEESAAAGEPLAAPAEIQLLPDPNRRGAYRGQFIPTAPGRYTASIRLPGGPGQEDVVVSAEIDARESSIEIASPQMDRDKLSALAARSAGGDYYHIAQALTLPDIIPDRHETRITRGTPIPLWDAYWMLALLIGLLCVEWALRKKFQML